ncbi:uncharacterized protein LOC142354120 [Convolutriloba macropyga]|uniref:uncharacterized protein LOC142354120 n=1 Tax=Convolutriloba macropyga TaxID=536237 RepID=UPI003F525005
MLLTLATVFNLLFRAKKLRDSKQQYTTDDIDLSRKHLIRNSQENSFHTAVASLKRGLKPHKLLYSDNGKTFIGASEELKKSVKSLDNDKIYKALAATNTTWKFNPPGGSKRLSLDVFQTILAESEAILNSRPLTNVADLPDNEMPLTPNHFLISRPFNSLPPGKFDIQTPASFRTWRNLQQMMNHFWKRLVKEYLPTLLKRSKWNENNQSPLKVNDVVWILKDMTPRGIWPLGRVLESQLLSGKVTNYASLEVTITSNTAGGTTY